MKKWFGVLLGVAAFAAAAFAMAKDCEFETFCGPWSDSGLPVVKAATNWETEMRDMRTDHQRILLARQATAIAPSEEEEMRLVRQDYLRIRTDKAQVDRIVAAQHLSQ